jgi:glutaredoxin
MTRKFVLASLVLLVSAGTAGAAQLYRWVDEKGRVEWRDTPPPANAKQVEQRNVGANTIETSTLPYSLQQAVKNFPVTLWAYDCGEPCNSARAHLARRGIPYNEKSSIKDGDALKKLTGSTDVPVLIVGKTTLRGYLDSQWDAELDAAGYPRSPAPGMKAAARSSGDKAPKAAADSGKGAPAK